jgi:tetratricopeptide (TPR) repeat protein
LDAVLGEGAQRDPYYNLKGLLLLWQNRPQEALPFLRKAQSISPKKSYIYINIGVALSRMGENEDAEWHFDEAIRLSPGSILPMFYRVENSLRANDPAKTHRYVKEMISIYGVKEVQENLKSIANRRDIAPISSDMINSAVTAAIGETPQRLVSRD